MQFMVKHPSDKEGKLDHTSKALLISDKHVRTFAIPATMIVADKHLGVIDDMRNGKDRVFNIMAEPIQDMINGAILIFFGAP